MNARVASQDDDQKSTDRRRGWRPAFGIRSLLILVTVVGLLLAVRVQRARERKFAERIIEKGGTVFFGSLPPPRRKRRPQTWGMASTIPPPDPAPVPASQGNGASWWSNLDRWLLGERVRVVGVTWIGDSVGDRELQLLRKFYGIRSLILVNSRVSDASAEILVGMRELRVLRLEGTEISDRTLARLADLPRLEEIDVMGTRVTLDGVRAFQRHNPGVHIKTNRQ